MFIGAFSCEELIEKYGSPCFIYDRDIIDKRCQQLLEALKVFPTKVKALYACKANTNINILKIMKQNGINGIDSVSPGEWAIALKAGFAPQDIIFTENNISDSEITESIKNNITLNIGEISTLERIGKLNPGLEIAIRINPDIGSGECSHVITGGKDSKFGIYFTQVDEVKEVCQKYNLKIIGLHQHIGSNIIQQDIDKYISSVKCIFGLANKFPDIKFINIGGGIGVPYKIDDVPLNLNQAFQEVAKLYKEIIQQNLGRDLEIWVEPGRFLIAESGFLLCTVTAMKSNEYHTFVGTDTGQNHLIRPAFYGSYHHIANASNYQNSQTQIVTVTGNICESGDIFAKDRQIELIKEKDVLTIFNAGAYCYSMSSNYNTRNKPPEVLISQDKQFLIRRRENLEDLLNTQLDVL